MDRSAPILLFKGVQFYYIQNVQIIKCSGKNHRRLLGTSTILSFQETVEIAMERSAPVLLFKGIEFNFIQK